MTNISQKKCGQCKHYYITWDKQHPHGCRAMNFKSKHLPHEIVAANYGSCQLFEARSVKSDDTSRKKDSGKLKSIRV